MGGRQLALAPSAPRVGGGFLRDMGVTTGATALVAALGIVTYKVAAHVGSVGAFIDYTTLRRYVALGAPILALGLGVEIPRSLAAGMPRWSVWRLLRWQAVVAGGTAVAAAIIAAVVVENRPLSLLFLALIAACSQSSLGLMVGVHRGLMDFRRQSWLAVVANGFAPLASVLLLPAGVAWVCAAWVGLTLLVITREGIAFRKGIRRSDRHAPELPKTHGLLRVPGDAAFALLLTFPVVAVQGVGVPQERAVFNYSLTLLTLGVTLTSPLSQVMLPRMVRQVAQGNVARARREVALIALISLAVGAAVSIPIGMFPKVFTRALLSPEYSSGAWVMAGFAFPLAAIVVFGALRSPLDALSSRPITGHICVLGMALLGLVVFSLGLSIASLLFGMCVSLGVMAVTTAVLALRLSGRSVA